MNASDTDMDRGVDDQAGTEVTGHLLGTAERPVVHLERWLGATPEEVWDAWTDPARTARWLGALEAPLDTVGRPVRLAMASSELPEDFAAAENPSTFTVREAVPPTGDEEGRLVFTFHDAADPGGLVTVTMRAADGGCWMTLRHALASADTALGYSSGFAAGWEAFVDWLEEVLATGEHGPDPAEDLRAAPYERRRDRLSRVHAGSVEGSTVRHERVIASPITGVWELLASADGLDRWLGRVVEGEPGPAARITFVHEGAAPHAPPQTSEITAWDPPRHLAMTWSSPDEPMSAVAISLERVDAGTRLVLAHTSVAPHLTEEHLAGWHASLDVLTGWAEGFAVASFALAHAAVR